eukprot:scaffold67421_cov33-Tisochrysis_lutea.AAC.5
MTNIGLAHHPSNLRVMRQRCSSAEGTAVSSEKQFRGALMRPVSTGEGEGGMADLNEGEEGGGSHIERERRGMNEGEGGEGCDGC